MGSVKIGNCVCDAVFPHKQLFGLEFVYEQFDCYMLLDGKELLIVDSFKRMENIRKGSEFRQPIYKSL